MFGEVGEGLVGKIVRSENVGDDGVGCIVVGNGLFSSLFESRSIRLSACVLAAVDCHMCIYLYIHGYIYECM